MAIVAMLPMAAGCAGVEVDTTGPGAGVQACEPPHATLVLWSAQWRPDQQDVPARETAAWQGIQQYFIRLSCKAEIRDGAALPADAAAFGRVVMIVVRELGVEVVVESKVIEGRSGKTLADLRTRWRSGAFAAKGAAGLQQGMTEALAATFR